MAYAVVRTDNLAGTTVGSLLRSAKSATAIQNGSVVKVTALATNEREIYTAAQATGAVMGEFALVAAPEKMYDERKKNLDEYTNEAGKAFRCYLLTHGDVFSATAEAFDATPTVGAEISLPATGYAWAVDAEDADAVGTVVAIEAESGYTFYVVRIN